MSQRFKAKRALAGRPAPRNGRAARREELAREVRLEVLREVARDGGPPPGGAARFGGALPPDEQLHKTRTRCLPPPHPSPPLITHSTSGVQATSLCQGLLACGPLAETLAWDPKPYMHAHGAGWRRDAARRSRRRRRCSGCATRWPTCARTIASSPRRSAGCTRGRAHAPAVPAPPLCPGPCWAKCSSRLSALLRLLAEKAHCIRRAGPAWAAAQALLRGCIAERLAWQPPPGAPALLSGPMRCSQPPRLHRSPGCLRRRVAPGLCAAAVAAVRCTATELRIVERGEGPYALMRTAGAGAAGAGGRAGERHALATAELPAAAAGGRSRAARPALLAAAAARARAGRQRRPGWRGAAAGPRGRRAALPPAPGRRRQDCRRLRRPRHTRAGESLGLAAAKRVVRSVGAAAPATSVLRMRRAAVRAALLLPMSSRAKHLLRVCTEVARPAHAQ